jgi:circadian clock protein KaiC
LSRERISTGISGLDSLICGGILRSSTVLVSGNPGTGKTILAAHYAFEGLVKGENVVYVSLSESKDQFLLNMELFGMNFGDFEQQKKFVFLDLASITQQGMKDALEEIMATVLETKAKRLVLDSISAITHTYHNQVLSARIIIQTILGKILRLEGVTTLLIAEIPTGKDLIGLGIEESVTDSNILMEHGSSIASPMTIRVVKMRGTKITNGPHVCDIISGKGMIVYPKQSLELTYYATNERLSSGISGLDQRTGGGFLSGTATAIVGAAGTGKTAFAFQFIAEGIKCGEAGMFYSFEESADEIRRMAEHFGYNVKDLERKGLKIFGKNAEHQSPDAFVAEIRNEIEKDKVKRLAIDGLSSFQYTPMVVGDNMYVIAKRFVSLAREKGITTIFPILVAQQADVILDDLGGLATIFQNIILLRYAEIQGRMKRTMLTLKMRSTPHDESILQFDISPIETTTNGTNDDRSTGSLWTKGPIKIMGSFEGYTGILTGVAQRLPPEIKKEEEEFFRKQQVAKMARRVEFQRKEEDIASRLKSESARRISEYKDEKVSGTGDNGKSSPKGRQQGVRKKRSKNPSRVK